MAAESAGERLRQAVKWSGKSIRAFHREMAAAGVPHSSYAVIHRYLRGQAAPGLEFLRPAAAHLGVREEWLVLDKGSPHLIPETAVETAVEMVPARNGGRLLSGGVPGHPGAGGRPPEEFKANLRRLVSRKETEAYLQGCLDGKEGPKAFAAALKYATDHGYGAAVQRTEVSGPDGGPVPTEIIVTRRLIGDDGDA